MKWPDGTRCDKTGRPRETEIQMHCSMTTNDQIYLVKELAICQYVLIIHSPHLCSLPGFKVEEVDVDREQEGKPRLSFRIRVEHQSGTSLSRERREDNPGAKGLNGSYPQKSVKVKNELEPTR